MTLTGYRRSDGRVGFRNHLVILPTSVCASEAAVRIAEEVSGAVALPHQHGCCQMGEDYRQTLRTLVGLASNPNVGAVLVVGLGCEGIQAETVREEIAAAGTRVAGLVIQEHGGTRGTVAEGVRLATEMAAELARTERVPCEVSDIVLGLECGGSDPTSGIASNPAVGVASDLLIDAGGLRFSRRPPSSSGRSTSSRGAPWTRALPRGFSKWWREPRSTRVLPAPTCGGASRHPETSPGA